MLCTDVAPGAALLHSLCPNTMLCHACLVYRRTPSNEPLDADCHALETLLHQVSQCRARKTLSACTLAAA